MLVRQTATYFAANAFSAAFGMLNVVVFTRLFAPAEFGTYVLGAGFAATLSTFLSSWLCLLILREQSRGDGTDVRGIVLIGFVVSCLIAPVAFAVARLVGLGNEAAFAAVFLALAIGFFELSQQMLRAQLHAFTVMKATMIRAVLVPCLGVSFTVFGAAGVLLLTSSALAYFCAALAYSREIWSGTVLQFDRARMWRYVKAGLPLTLSLTLLGMSSVLDRFLVAGIIGSSHAGQYAVGVDLVRQTLIIPAISVAAAFFPLAVQILADRGAAAVRAHLDECFEFLLAIVMPACFGFAIISSHVANVVLGPEFRSLASEVMPIISMAVIFQIMTYQYLHISFLLAERNAFYLLNTGSVLVFNAVISYGLILQFGAIGAAWARLAAEIFGFAGALLLTRWAFRIPLSLKSIASVLSATIVMSIVLRFLDMKLAVTDRDALIILISVGLATYMAACWFLDVARARSRLSHGVLTAWQTMTQWRARLVYAKSDRGPTGRG